MRVFTAYITLLLATLAHASPVTGIARRASQETSMPSAVPTFPVTGLHRPTPAASLARPTGAAGCRNRNTTTTYSLAAPKVTVPPAAGGEADVAEAGVKFRQTTYYTCVTWPSTVHCGWHEPILDASMDAAWSTYDSRRAAVWSVVVAGAASMIVLGI